MKLRFGSLQILALLALSVTALAAGAQSKNLPRIAWVLGTGPESRHLVEAIHAGLADEGLADGRDIILDVRLPGAGRSAVRSCSPT